MALCLGASPGATAVMARLECHRCHEVEGLAPPPTVKHCAGCHRELAGSANDAAKLEQGRKTYGDAFDRFVRRTATHYVDVPPLVSMRRFRASWLRSFLADPLDLRPHLTESMPRLPLTPADLDALTSGLSADAPAPAASPEQLALGARLFEAKACTSCHLFGTRRFPSQPAALFEVKAPAISVLARAPDLRHVRDRLNRDVVVKLLRSPRAVNARAQMPNPGLSRAEAEALADFLLQGALGPPVEPEAVPVAQHVGPARYEDVEARVFRKVCWHCHSNPDFVDGEGGPGNTGGFGFKGAGLSLATYEEVMNGSLGPDGEYRSVFRKGPSGEPVLLEVLRRRVEENARDFVRPGHEGLRAPLASAGPLGMPLGLPALAPDDLALVEAWIAAGKPRPATPPGLQLTPMGR